MIGARIGAALTLNTAAVVGCGNDELGAQSARVLIAFGGQSNAEPHASASFLTDQSLAQPYPNVLQLGAVDQNYGDDPMRLQETPLQYLGTSNFDNLDRDPFVFTPSVGFEITLLRDLDRARPGGFATVRFAVGGSPSNRWEPDQTNFPTMPAGALNYFHQWMDRIEDAMARTGSSRVVIVWEQGESDAKTETESLAYGGFLGRLVDAIRVRLGPTVPFVYGKLNADVGPTYVYKDNLRAQQVAFEATRPYCKLVDQDSVAIDPSDGLHVHYSADGYAALGHLWSPAVASMIGLRIPPQAAFTPDVISLTATFTDASLSQGDTITSWRWDFGDGATSTAQSPTHVYSGTGTYNVTLQVTNTAGDTNSVTVPVPVVGGYAGVSRDATSLKYVPRDATQWSTFLAAIGSSMSTPDALWLCQEASGHILDKIGAIDLIETNNPTSSFRSVVSGWTRYFIKQTDSSAKGFSSSSASLPDISTTSMLTLAFVLMPASAPSGSRAILMQGTLANRSADVLLSSGAVQAWSTTSNVATGASHVDGTVHPVVTLVDRTNNRSLGYTDKSKMAPTFGAGMAGQGIAIGAFPSSLLSMAGGYGFVVSWFGVKAEVTDADIRTLLQGLGFSVLW